MTDAITLREAVDIVGPMSRVQLDEAAAPGYSPSIVRMLARMRRDDSATWYGLCADIDRKYDAGPRVRVWPRNPKLDALVEACQEFVYLDDIADQLRLSKKHIGALLTTLSATYVVERKRDEHQHLVRIAGRKVAAA